MLWLFAPHQHIQIVPGSSSLSWLVVQQTTGGTDVLMGSRAVTPSSHWPHYLIPQYLHDPWSREKCFHQVNDSITGMKFVSWVEITSLDNHSLITFIFLFRDLARPGPHWWLTDLSLQICPVLPSVPARRERTSWYLPPGQNRNLSEASTSPPW